MQLLQATELLAGQDFIKFLIEYPTEIAQAKLKVIVLEQKFNFSANKPEDQIKHIKLCEIVFEKHPKTNKLPSKIKIEDLPSGTLYKFNFCVVDEENQKVETNVFSTTKGLADQSEKENIKQESKSHIEPSLKNKLLDPAGNFTGLCESENILSKFTQIHNIGLDTFSSAQDITKNLLDARQTNSSSNYINSSYKFAKPEKLYQLRKKRAFLIGYQNEMMEEIFGFQKEYKTGKSYGNNDWFMGPFYSYENNVKFK